MTPATAEWQAVGRDGVSTCWLSDPMRASLRGRRMRKRIPREPADAGAWPAPWRAIAQRWLRRALGDRPIRRDTLLRQAGADAANDALRLIEHLFVLGQLCAEEQQSAHGWQATRYWFLDPAALREALGLADPDEAARDWQALAQRDLVDDDLRAAAATLADKPPRLAIARFGLLEALLSRRQADGGRAPATKRDFAYEARGDTKAISTAEWQWLESVIDLAADGIADHVPLLLLAGRFRLATASGQIDCGALGGFVGVPAVALDSLDAIIDAPTRWRVVENRSAFDHVARTLPSDEGAVWLPGYPPLWWREAAERLLLVAPAPAAIACDPDPDGVQIAMQAGAVWQARGLDWTPWRMDAAALSALPHHRPLSERDRRLCEQLLAQDLPEGLHRLLCWMRDTGLKGEQEALFSQAT
ncbi:MAG: hypothetical protein KDH20_07860 [Rhodocyclaceae bacterium]|nr:hypothetical protein [Rhodocyclaceae bacterium]